LPGMELASVPIKSDAESVGQTIAWLEEHFANKLKVLAIRRVADIITHPNTDVLIKTGDRLVVFASRQDIESLNRL
jgi:Trk K+ transport system NAD-binding subunit